VVHSKGEPVSFWMFMVFFCLRRLFGDLFGEIFGEMFDEIIALYYAMDI